jgi:hypothetical protein
MHALPRSAVLRSYSCNVSRAAAVYVANMQTEDVSFLHVDATGALTRQGFVTVGVTDQTPDPSSGGGGGGPGPGSVILYVTSLQ